MRKTMTRQDIERITKLYKEGKSVKDISQETGFGYPSIYRVVKEIIKDEEPKIVNKSNIDVSKTATEIIQNTTVENSEQNELENQKQQAQEPQEQTKEIEEYKQTVENLRQQIVFIQNELEQKIKQVQNHVENTITPLTSQIQQTQEKILSMENDVKQGFSQITTLIQQKVLEQTQTPSEQTRTPQIETQDDQQNIPAGVIGQPTIQQISPAQLQPSGNTSIVMELAKIAPTILQQIIQFRQAMQPPQQQFSLERVYTDVKMINEIMKVFGEKQSQQPLEIVTEFLMNMARVLNILRKSGLQKEQIMPSLINLAELFEAQSKNLEQENINKNTDNS